MELCFNNELVTASPVEKEVYTNCDNSVVYPHYSHHIVKIENVKYEETINEEFHIKEEFMLPGDTAFHFENEFKSEFKKEESWDVTEKQLGQFEKRFVEEQHDESHLNQDWEEHSTSATCSSSYSHNLDNKIHKEPLMGNTQFQSNNCDSPIDESIEQEEFQSDFESIPEEDLKGSRLLHCAKCSYKTKFKQNLNRHYDVKHRKLERFLCKFCDYKSTRKDNLDMHINAVHTKTKIYKCAQCDHGTYRKYRLVEHIRKKHMKAETVKCENCKNGSCHKHEIRLVHCPYCKHSTTRRGNLNQHVLSKHNSEVLECKQCSYKTFNVRQMKRHTGSKHGDNTLKCQYCDYCATEKSHLKRHINCKHTKKEIFECESCDYKTTIRYSLVTHIRKKHLNNNEKVEALSI